MLLNMVAFAGDMLILWNFAGIFRSSKLANREVLPIKNRPKGHSSDGILLTLLLLWASSTWGRKPTAREDAARSWLLISAHATIMIHVSLRPNMDLICKHSHCYQKPSFHHVHHDHCDHNHDDHKSYLSLSYNHMPLWWSVISIMISTGSFLREFAWIKSATLVFSQKSEPPCLNSRNQTVLNFLGGNSSQRLSPKWSPQSLTSDLDSHTDHLPSSTWSRVLKLLQKFKNPRKKSVPQSQIVEKDIRTTVSTWGRNTPLRSKNFVVGRFNDKTTTVTTADSGCFGPPYLHPLALGIHHTWTQSLLLSRQFSLWFLDLSEESLSCDRFLIPVV